MSGRLSSPWAALLTSLCLAGGCGLAQADTWTNLWSTHEQQAQKLLDSKHPEAAAPLFSDARRRAYAELQSGQYAKAAKSLAPFKDAGSQYNRGNALAHAGQLREALTAYDSALAASPGDKDVIRNRDLVKRALEQQQRNQSGQQGGSKGQPGSQGSQGGQSQGGNHSPGGGQPQPGGQSQTGSQQAGNQSQRQGQSQASGSQSQGGGQSQGSNPGGGGQAQSADQQQGQSQGGGNQAQARDQPQNGAQSQAAGTSQAANPSQGSGTSQAPDQSQAGGTSQAANQPQSARQSQPGSPTQGTAQSQPGANRAGDNTSGEGALAPDGQQTNGSMASGSLNAQNAQQDADAALRYRQSQQGQSASETSPRGAATTLAPDGKAHSSADVPPPKPPSEQALALDQWLRGIPDDSAELLRRKFLIEHMLKQQHRNEP